MQQRRESMSISPPAILFNNVPFTYLFCFIALFISFMFVSTFFRRRRPYYACIMYSSSCLFVRAALLCSSSARSARYLYAFLFVQQFWYSCVICMMCHFRTRFGILYFVFSVVFSGLAWVVFSYQLRWHFTCLNIY